MTSLNTSFVAVDKPRLLDQLRDAIRLPHYSIRIEEAYINWAKRYIFFYGKDIRRKWDFPK